MKVAVRGPLHRMSVTEGFEYEYHFAMPRAWEIVVAGEMPCSLRGCTMWKPLQGQGTSDSRLIGSEVGEQHDLHSKQKMIRL